MIDRHLDIQTRDGVMNTFITHPEEEGPHPVVLLLMDAPGKREELHDMALRIATVGYCCLVPDLYYRQGKIHHLFRDEDNRMISLHKLDEETRNKVLAPMRKLSDTMAMRDSGALIELVQHVS